MAEQIISPGVFINEDVPTITEAAAAPIGAAVVGPTPLGPVHIPTVCTTFSDFQSKFGTTFESGGIDYSFLTSIAAFKYFQQGGTNLLITRVVSGSSSTFAQATSTLVRASGSSADNVFTLKTFSEGISMNSTSSIAQNDISSTLVSGSRDNLRFEITNRDESKGTFTLAVRQGNDSNTSKKVLETFRGVNLDPNSDNFIAKRIGNQFSSTVTEAGNTYIRINGDYPAQSAYVYISDVAKTTPDYLNSAGVRTDNNYTGSIPDNQNGAFASATGTLFEGEIKMGKDITTGNMQGLEHTQYATAINILEDKDLYYFNTISSLGILQLLILLLLLTF